MIYQLAPPYVIKNEKNYSVSRLSEVQNDYLPTPIGVWGIIILYFIQSGNAITFIYLI